MLLDYSTGNVNPSWTSAPWLQQMHQPLRGHAVGGQDVDMICHWLLELGGASSLAVPCATGMSSFQNSVWNDLSQQYAFNGSKLMACARTPTGATLRPSRSLSSALSASA
jgi:hypothetical protein